MTAPTATPLLRTLSLTQITLYGIGTILGAGIYVLVGEVANTSGTLMPFAFVLAALVVSFSAYSYGQLSRLYPVSAGEPVYVQQAFGIKSLSTLVGYAIVFAGIVSAATIARGFSGYLSVFMTLPDSLTISLLILLLSAIAAWGVKLSVSVAVTTTLLELLGLAFVIYAGANKLPSLLSDANIQLIPDTSLAWKGVGAGAFIAFYAFIGFEDMVNMAEEVKQPEKNMPRGILLALVTACLLYFIVTLCTLAAVPLKELAASKAPLVLVVEQNTAIPTLAMAGISIVAVVNGALLQIIMASRVLYGMGKRDLGPGFLATVHPRSQTPLLATALVGALVLTAALLAPLVTLAQATSGTILGIFILVNLALLRLNWRKQRRNFMSLAIPTCGAFICAVFLLVQFWL
ncbi:MAG: amino acid permease [Gammaproteobacteria bacterium]|nr:amino acid permease [Gammaproteobacteria bacterium]MBQ0838570.1 amino acid permease [Gammaproteobacteria bacterium]